MSARAAFQSANSGFASSAEIGKAEHTFGGLTACAADLVRITDAHPKRQAIAVQIVDIEITHSVGTIAGRMHDGRPARPQLIVQRVDLGYKHVDGALAGFALRLVSGLEMNRNVATLDAAIENRITVGEVHLEAENVAIIGNGFEDISDHEQGRGRTKP
jgi:hypothetical protein